MSIRANDLIDVFERMAREHWSYEWGAARKGRVDCSGAFVYAYQLLGGPKIEHGSNAIARNRVVALLPASQAKPGYAMLKWRQDGAPEKYTDGKGNFFHIGLMGRNGKVLNAKSTTSGFVESPVDGWQVAAQLKDVKYTEYDEEKEDLRMLYSAKVATQSGKLRVRDNPVDGSILGHLQKGCTVQVLEERDGWMRVRYGDLVGWVSGLYLEPETDGVDMDVADCATVQIVIRDEAGHEFRPVGAFTVDVEVVLDGDD